MPCTPGAVLDLIALESREDDIHPQNNGEHKKSNEKKVSGRRERMT
jgi:hypothetical protein